MSALAPALKRGVKALVNRYTGPIGSVVAVRTSAPQIVLTFDDGPEPGGTDQVLTALATWRATATFFVLMTRVRRFGTLLDDVVAGGHEVALHGVDHQPLTRFRYVEARRRTADARAELEDRLGHHVRWFRPPYGSQTPSTWRAVLAAGLTPVMWGPTTWDWRDVSQDERVQRAQQGACGGAILLAHDGFAGAIDHVPQQPIPVVDRGNLITRVLDAYAERGLSGCSLTDALVHGSAIKAARFDH